MSRKAARRNDDLVISQAHWFIVVLAAVSLLAVVLVPVLQTADFKDQNEARRTVVQVCGGLFAVLVFLVSVARVRTSHRDLEAQLYGEMNTRYIQFIAQLGSVRDGASGVPNIETRCGAIYGLQKLGLDSVTYYPTIVSYLARYVRMCAPDPRLKPGDTAPGFGERTRDSGLRFDIQTAMEVVTQPSPHTRSDRPRLDLSETSLDNLRLERGDFRGANMRLVSLRSATLTRAKLTGAVLASAELDGANLVDADLCGADLSASNLLGTRLEKARFDAKTTFANADLEGAWFYSEESSGLLESGRGLTAKQILEARNWDRARFSIAFENELRDVEARLSGGSPGA